MREQFEQYWATLKDLADPIQKETAYLFFMRGWFSHQEERLRELRNEVKSSKFDVIPTVNYSPTIKEPENKWYSEYPEWLKRKLFENAKEGSVGVEGTTYYFSKSTKILDAFEWQTSPQGHDYWVELHLISRTDIDKLKTLPESWKPTT
jgi:hypothetical protein